MIAHLVAHKPARSQFRAPRRARPTGCTVLHTAESILDTVGPDTGAEAVAAFMVGRSEPGSYHDLADSDSVIHLVPYEFEAFQDGTGSNPWALSISFALRASDWSSLSDDRRDAFLRQGVVAFGRQQAWLRENDYPVTPLRRITKAQSDVGWAGFVTHGDRDPDRRSDPGNDFPWARWFELCADPGATPNEEDDMTPDQARDLTESRAILGGLAHIFRNPDAAEGEVIARLRDLSGMVGVLEGSDAAAIAAAIPAELARQVADELAARLTKESA